MKYNVTVNGKKYEVEIEKSGAVSKETEIVKNETVNVKADAVGEEAVTSPMPGSILEIKVENGQAVKKGDILLVLEAMKMENEILAGYDGIVSQIAASKGSNVNTGDLLLTLKHTGEGV